MILTGKAKEHFEAWLSSEMYVLPDNGIEGLGALFLNALIIEWLDSVGIYIDITYRPLRHVFKYNLYIFDAYAPDGIKSTRQEATEAAILTANNLYNDTAK